MFQDRDYVMRIIREFTAFLAKVLSRKTQAEEARTIAELDDLAGKFVGMSLGMLESLSAGDLLQMLGTAGGLDASRAYAAGRLLEERAQLAVESGAQAGARNLYRKSLWLLAASALEFDSYLGDEHRTSLHRVTDNVLLAAASDGRAAGSALGGEVDEARRLEDDQFDLPVPLLAELLEVHLVTGENERLAAIARRLSRSPRLQQQIDEGSDNVEAADASHGTAQADPMRALRVALAGKHQPLIARIAQVLDAEST